MKDIWLIIFSIGIAQGLFLIIALLLLKEKRKISINLLIFLLLCFLSLIINEWFKTLFTVEQMAFTYRIGETIPLLIGPLFLFYIMSVVKSDFNLDKKLFVHFLPFIIFLVLFLPFYLKPTGFKIQFIKSLDGKATTTGLALFSFFKGIHSVVYFIISWFYVKRNSITINKRVKPWFNVKLLMRLILLQLIAIVIIYGVVGLEYFNPVIEIESDRISSLILTLSFFVFAFAIILVPSSMVPEKLPRAKKGRYLSSSLKEKDKKLIISNLNELLTDKKLYLNSDLSLVELAEMLDVNSNQLSQVINEVLAKNFHQLINEYRVDEVKRNISDQSKTLLGIALDSGFNSKSAFNRIFKKNTGLTPSEYKKTL